MGHVYIITDGSPDLYKIGATTRDVRHRKYCGQVFNANTLRIVASIECIDPFDIEDRIKIRYAHLRIIRMSGFGEWYKLPAASLAEVQDFIKANASLERKHHPPASHAVTGSRGCSGEQ